MNNCKHICDLSWCEKHSKCIYSNAESVLKSDAYEVKVSNKENADIILCYQKQLDTSVYTSPYFEEKKYKVSEPQIKRIEDSDDSWKVSLRMKEQKKELCENPKCKLGNPVSVVKHNNEINLCQGCNDLIHDYKSNHELARYFNSKTKIVKLLACIRELEKESNENPSQVIRCTNIYCGTELNITRHHLVPKPFRKGIEGKIETIPLCEDCHKKVHRLKTNTQLAKHYNTKQSIIELLAGDISFRVMRVLNVNEERMSAVA